MENVKRLFEKINKAFEGKYIPLSDRDKKILMRNIININHALLKNKLKHDIIVHRYDKYAYRLWAIVKRFLSTSATRKGVFKKNPNVAIIVPKGSIGTYVEELSKKPQQREFLFNANSCLREILFFNGLTIYEVIKIRGDKK